MDEVFLDVNLTAICRVHLVISFSGTASDCATSKLIQIQGASVFIGKSEMFNFSLKVIERKCQPF